MMLQYRDKIRLHSYMRHRLPSIAAQMERLYDGSSAEWLETARALEKIARHLRKINKETT